MGLFLNHSLSCRAPATRKRNSVQWFYIYIYSLAVPALWNCTLNWQWAKWLIVKVLFTSLSLYALKLCYKAYETEVLHLLVPVWNIIVGCKIILIWAWNLHCITTDRKWMNKGNIRQWIFLLLLKQRCFILWVLKEPKSYTFLYFQR